MDALQQNINYLGANSYPAILHESISALQSLKADTIVGSEMVKNVLTKTSKSLAPMLAISEFMTNAEAISKDDASVADVIAFMKKQFKGGDLNFLMNLAKEEHFAKLSRTGFPSPKETIKAYEKEFNTKSGDLPKKIELGIFEGLESDIYNEIRLQFPQIKKSKNKIVDGTVMTAFDGIRDLKESVTVTKSGIQKYHPIGMKFEDLENERILLLTESSILEFNIESGEVDKVNIAVELPYGHRRIMTAVSQLVYDYEKELFKPSERWDFKLGIDKNGNAILSNPKEGYEAQSTIIKKDDLRGFLEESIKFYDSMLVKPSGYNKELYTRDADNLILLAESSDQLLKLDNLLVLKDKTNQQYVMINSDLSKQPKIYDGADVTEVELYESYSQLQQSIEKRLQKSLNGVFENQISQEQLFTQEKFETLQKLQDENIEIEGILNDVLTMKKKVDADSNSFKMLLEKENDLTAKLEKNIIEQTYFETNKMYK